MILNTRVFMDKSYYLDQYQKGSITKKALANASECHFKTNKLKISIDLLIDLLLSHESKQVRLSEQEKKLQAHYFKSKNIYFDRLYQKKFGVDITYKSRNHILRFFAAYFDDGSAYWVMPNRNAGFGNHFVIFLNQPAFLTTCI